MNAAEEFLTVDETQSVDIDGRSRVRSHNESVRTKMMIEDFEVRIASKNSVLEIIFLVINEIGWVLGL